MQIQNAQGNIQQEDSGEESKVTWLENEIELKVVPSALVDGPFQLWASFPNYFLFAFPLQPTEIFLFQDTDISRVNARLSDAEQELGTWESWDKVKIREFRKEFTGIESTRDDAVAAIVFNWQRQFVKYENGISVECYRKAGISEGCFPHLYDGLELCLSFPRFLFGVIPLPPKKLVWFFELATDQDKLAWRVCPEAMIELATWKTWNGDKIDEFEDKVTASVVAAHCPNTNIS